jgi:hypothetical protein
MMRCNGLLAVAVLAVAAMPASSQPAKAQSVAEFYSGKPITFIVGEGYNHFEIQETLATPYGLLGHEVLKLMKLA